MKSSKNFAESKGALLFAFNTDTDYVGIADQSARLIRHFLDLPVTLVTDSSANPGFEYDQVIRIDNDSGNNVKLDLNLRQVAWRKIGRAHV